MAYEICSGSVDFTLPTYDSFGIGPENDGSNHSLSEYVGTAAGDATVIMFVNAQNQAQAVGWLEALHAIHNSGGSVQSVAVLFMHNGTDFSAITNSDTRGTVNATSPGHAGFGDIPVFYDDPPAAPAKGKSQQYLEGITGDSVYGATPPSISTYEMWAYIVVGDGSGGNRITDKWHSDFTPADPVSLNNMPGGFDAGDSATLAGAVGDRIVHLQDPLGVIETDPVSGSVLTNSDTSFDLSITISFSKPLAAAAGGTAANYVLGGADVVEGAGAAQSADYSGANLLENVVTIAFQGVTLHENLGGVTVTMSNITDCLGSPLQGTNATITYEADFGPPEPSLWTSEPSPTNNSSFQMTVDFGEPVDTAGPGSWFSVTGAATVDAGSFSASGHEYSFTINVDPSVDDTTIAIGVNPGVTTDDVGNPNTGSAPGALTIEYDGKAPTASLSSATVAAGSHTCLTSWDLDLTLDEPASLVSGPLTGSDFATSHCTVDSVSPNGSAYTVTISVEGTATSGDLVTVQLNGDVFEDGASNRNAVSSIYSVTYDGPCSGTTLRDLVVLMDVSNSMNGEVEIEGVTDTKIRHMGPRVEQFLNTLAAGADDPMEMGDPNDRVALLRYDSSASVIQLNGSDWTDLGDLDLNAPGAPNWSDIPAQGNTAMGPALRMAFNMLSYTQDEATYGRKRDILIFADGQDNVPPKVQLDATQFSIGDMTISSSDAHNIEIHTIGITTPGGYTSAWLQRLAGLSSVTGGQDYAIAENQIWDDVDGDLQSIYEELYADSSPRVVYRNRSRLEPVHAAATESFVLAAGVPSVLFCLSWPGNEALTMSLYKGSLKISSYTVRRGGGRHLILGLRFPLKVWNPHILLKDKLLASRLETGLRATAPDRKPPRPAPIRSLAGVPIGDSAFGQALWQEVHSGGSWSIVVERAGSTFLSAAPYSLAVVANDHNVSLDLTLPVGFLQSGRPLNVLLRASDLGYPLDTIYEAQMVVKKPMVGVGDLLAKYASQIKPIDFEGASSGSVDALIRGLAAIPEANAAMSRVVTDHLSAKPLVRRDKKQYARALGRFRWHYPNTTVPGLYRLEFTIRGVSRKGGVFERRLSRSVMVRPRLSPSQSVVDHETGSLAWRIIPKDSFGNLLGPGHSESVQSNFAGEEQLDVKDNGDGSYQVSAERVEKRQEVLRISFYQETVVHSREPREEL